MGTVNLLDIAFTKEYVKAVTIVTTDKVYKNDNSGKAFIESDPLEGKDPYSASKVGTEAVVAAWQQIAKVTGGPVVTSVRAGNVIGGGDFARDRLIPDLIRGLISGNVVEIRNPESIRPWQHVLDPLAGYLQCLESALIGEISNSFNFGPSGKMITVAEIISIARTMFPEIRISYLEHSTELEFESAILNLDSKNSTDNLNWKPFFNQKEAIISTLEWWQKYLMDNSSPSDSCLREIESFLEIKD
jgi:CDP-glucose 4,6-dehydratase